MESIAEKVAENTAKIENIEKRLDVCEEQTKAINSLAQSIVKMDVTLNNTNDTVKELKKDFGEMKEEPRKRWNAAVLAVISAGAGAIITAIVSAIAVLL